jgi:hypothetical protein
MPQRIQMRRDRPWQTTPKAIVCARRTGSCGPYGNPYRVGPDGSAEACVAQFVRLYDNPLARARYRKALARKDLACWCRVGDVCHVDTLLRWANE